MPAPETLESPAELDVRWVDGASVGEPTPSEVMVKYDRSRVALDAVAHLTENVESLLAAVRPRQ